MGELKYSIKALEEMEKMYDKSLSIIGDRDDVVTNGKTYIEFKDVIFTDSKLILNGLVFHVLKMNGDLEREDISIFTDMWDKKTKRFSESVINKVLNNHFSLLFIVRSSLYATPDTDGFAGITSDGNVYIDISTKKLVEPVELRLNFLLRHELQHVTQSINNICLYYGKQLSKLKDINDIRSIPEFDYVSYRKQKEIYQSTGVGRDKLDDRGEVSYSQRMLDLHNNSSLTTDEKNDKEQALHLMYLANNNEYETWKTATVRILTCMIISLNNKTRGLGNYFIVTNSNLDKKIRDDRYKKEKGNVISPSKLITSSLKSILNKDGSEIDINFKKSSDHYNFVHEMKKHRPKEIVGDLLTGMEKFMEEFVVECLSEVRQDWKPYKKIAFNKI